MSVELATRRRPGGLLWNRDFRLFWLGETTSNVGSAMAVVAMPLTAVAVLHASTFVVGALQATAWLPWLLIGLPAGAWVDRLPKRRVMVACDCVAFVLFGSVPIAAWTGVLTTAQLVVVALLAGSVKVFFSNAYSPYLRTVVTAEHRPEANAKLQGSASAAQLVGPGLGGLAAELLGAVSGLAANALSFAYSALCLMRIRAVEQPPARADGPRTALRAEIAEGLRFVARDPYLRVMVAFAGAGNFGDAIMESVVVVYLVRTVGVNAGVAGGLVAAMSVGGVTGAMISGRVARRFGNARGLLLCQITGSPFMLLLALTTKGAGVVFFLAGGIIYLTGTVAANVMIATFIQTYVPESILGRVTATESLIGYGTLPLGALTGALVGEAYGPRTAIWVSAIVITISACILLAGPLRHRRNLPATSAPMQEQQE
ncbi:MAG TPA: MFS transporter [Streptosporangiaceae bacterium]